MMPNTVPSRPTNGAEDETVASTGSPRRRFISSRSLTRSIARLHARDDQLELPRIAGPRSAEAIQAAGVFADAAGDHARDRAAPPAGLERRGLAQPPGGHQRLQLRM